MCLSKYSNIELLKEVAMNLHLSKEHENKDGLCERDLAALINFFYQSHDCEVTTKGEKRKKEEETKNDIKKLKVPSELCDDISPLEKLPNEVFANILKYLKTDGKKSIRMTCKRLFENTSMLDPMFSGDWCFDAVKGTPPDFVLDSNKNFKVFCSISSLEEAAGIGNMINRFAYRVSSLSIEDHSSSQMTKTYLKDMKPAEFPNLICLEIKYCEIDNNSLLFLAPQLESLTLDGPTEDTQFDLSTVNDADDSFTKIKKLNLQLCKIDVKKILSKCSKTIRFLKYDSLFQVIAPDDLQQDLQSLNYFCFHFTAEDPEHSVRNLVSKATSNRLRTLTLGVATDEVLTYSLSNLLDKRLNITTLCLNLGNGGNKINTFLDKCPLVQNLTIYDHHDIVDNLDLKYLTELTLRHCNFKCTKSVLEQAPKVKRLHLEAIEWIDCKDLVVPEIEIVWLDTVQFYSMGRPIQASSVYKLFPKDIEVQLEDMPEKDLMVFRRV